MLKKRLIAVAMLAALAAGCVDESPKDKDGSYILSGAKKITLEDGSTLSIVLIDGHSYFIYDYGYRGGICHSASCCKCAMAQSKQ